MRNVGQTSRNLKNVVMEVMPFVPANASRTQQLKRQQNNHRNGKRMKYLVQNQCRQDSSSYSWFQVWDYWHLISTRTEWRLHMICTHSGLKQEVTAAVVGHLVEEPVCSNWRWSVSQVFFIRICSISSIWRICTPVVHCTICAPSTVFLAVSPCLL